MEEVHDGVCVAAVQRELIHRLLHDAPGMRIGEEASLVKTFSAKDDPWEAAMGSKPPKFHPNSPNIPPTNAD